VLNRASVTSYLKQSTVSVRAASCCPELSDHIQGVPGGDVGSPEDAPDDKSVTTVVIVVAFRPGRFSATRRSKGRSSCARFDPIGARLRIRADGGGGGGGLGGRGGGGLVLRALVLLQHHKAPPHVPLILNSAIAAASADFSSGA
jgi:hypothetical protein